MLGFRMDRVSRFPFLVCLAALLSTFVLGCHRSDNTNGFTNISGNMVIPGNGAQTNSYTHSGAATNFATGYYCIWQLP